MKARTRNVLITHSMTITKYDTTDMDMCIKRVMDKLVEEYSDNFNFEVEHGEDKVTIRWKSFKFIQVDWWEDDE